MCKSCPGLALRASVKVLVIRAVNECLKWVFLPRGGPASRRLWNIRHSAWTNNARGLLRFALSCFHGHLLQNKHSLKSWLLKILTQQNKRLAFYFSRNRKVGIFSFIIIVLRACHQKRICCSSILNLTYISSVSSVFKTVLGTIFFEKLIVGKIRVDWRT